MEKRRSRMPYVAAFLIFLIMIAGMLNSFDFADIGTMFGSSAPVECVGGTPNSWMPLAWIALILSILIVSVGYIVSGLFGSAKLNEWLRGTLWGVAETAAILSVLTLSFAGLEDFGVKNIDTARAYSTLIRNTVVFDFALMVFSNMIISFVAHQKPNIKLAGFKAFATSFQIAPMFRPIFDGLGAIMQLIAAAVAEWFAHEFLLCFIKNTMLPLFLPLGIFLRAFGPQAKAGANALIGLAISLYFVYPFMMVQFGEMITNYFENELAIANPPHIWATCVGDKPMCCVGINPQPEDENEPFIANGKRGYDPWPASKPYRLSQEKVLQGDIVISIDGQLPVVGSGVFCIYNTVLSKAVGGVFEKLSGMGAFGGVAGVAIGTVALNKILQKFNISWLAAFLLPPILTLLLYGIYEVIFFLFIVSLVIPIFIIFITITLAKEVAKALGTEIDLSALEKII
ncbi:MAG: hypothetical protein N3E51_03240 [Candidatus Micrarchaeota archaeon]|nr:hypothetical protein [Candidatus Micrarchaeota archaeon]